LKKFNRNPLKFGVVELYSMLEREKSYSFDNNKSIDEFIEKIKTSLQQSMKNQSTLHGINTQEMFGHLTNALDKSVIIKQEDSGQIFKMDRSFKIPDFRLLLNDGQKILVEVKNYYKTKAPYKIDYDYLNGLIKYAKSFECSLKIAIYWAKWNIWTLVSDSNIKDNGKSYSISLAEAILSNDMNILGDKMLATKPPLKIRVIIDRNTLYLNHNKEPKYKIKNIEIYCNSIRIEDAFEKKIAYHLILTGKWPLHGPFYDKSNKDFIISEFVFEPLEKDYKKGFSTIGFLSSMYSTLYKFGTMNKNGDVYRISPKNPQKLSLSIPSNYKGKYLPLWQFIISK